ncbi:hypothetical protein GGF31_008680 [Allomyces arbusculus]|nr:hypothetical protein GGF31_008680 [Allomyces arbusculus]
MIHNVTLLLFAAQTALANIATASSPPDKPTPTSTADTPIPTPTTDASSLTPSIKFPIDATAEYSSDGYQHCNKCYKKPDSGEWWCKQDTGCKYYNKKYYCPECPKYPKSGETCKYPPKEPSKEPSEPSEPSP